GNRFFIVHLGYPTYHPENGTIKSPTSDITCLNRVQNPTDIRCTIPAWANNAAPFAFNITKQTLQRDTLIVPPNGYAVLNIKSNNPGWWSLHCHIEVHNFEGMS
ncbi:multicopper oxidase domain-containing protein, partial [Salmonella sp. s54836]|uniref:multicopper oxidase domain-containing protein n=1 Tax=Salmonella sp. s54836 TaxID=3159673 RepID=UPI00397FB70D